MPTTTMTVEQYEREIERMQRRLGAKGLVLSNDQRDKLERYLAFLLNERGKLSGKRP